MAFFDSRDWNINDVGDGPQLCRAEGMSLGTVTVGTLVGSYSAAKFTLIVRNTLGGNWEDHPAAISFNANKGAYGPFDIAGWTEFGVRLSTANGAALNGRVNLCATKA